MADTGKLKRENTALLRQAMQNGSAGKNDLARGYVSHAPLLPSGSGGSLVVPPD